MNPAYFNSRPWLLRDGKYPARWLKAMATANHRARMAEALADNAVLKTLLRAAKAGKSK